MEYRYVLDCDVVAADVRRLISIMANPKLIRASLRRLLQVMRVFGFHQPFQKGESSFKDSTLRDIQKKRFGRWAISFWADHAVKELRVVGIQSHKL